MWKCDTTTETQSLTTVEQAFEIIGWLKENNGGTVSEIATQLSIPKSTAHNYLSTLHNMNYILKEDGEYRISLRFLCIGGYAAAEKDGYATVRPKIKELARETNERSQFIVEEFGYGIYIHTEVESHRAVKTDATVGKSAHLHTTAAGKSILANLPEERMVEIVRKTGLPERTTRTITDESILFDELETIRERGFAYNDEERIKGQRAVGAAITKDNEVLGALSISGPKNRLEGTWYRDEIPDLLLGTINELELNLAYP